MLFFANLYAILMAYTKMYQVRISHRSVNVTSPLYEPYRDVMKRMQYA